MKDPPKAVAFGKDKAKLEETLVKLEADWMIAAEAYETAKAEAGV